MKRVARRNPATKSPIVSRSSDIVLAWRQRRDLMCSCAQPDRAGPCEVRAACVGSRTCRFVDRATSGKARRTCRIGLIVKSSYCRWEKAGAWMTRAGFVFDFLPVGRNPGRRAGAMRLGFRVATAAAVLAMTAGLAEAQQRVAPGRVLVKFRAGTPALAKGQAVVAVHAQVTGE